MVTTHESQSSCHRNKVKHKLNPSILLENRLREYKYDLVPPPPDSLWNSLRDSRLANYRPFAKGCRYDRQVAPRWWYGPYYCCHDVKRFNIPPTRHPPVDRHRTRTSQSHDNFLGNKVSIQTDWVSRRIQIIRERAPLTHLTRSAFTSMTSSQATWSISRYHTSSPTRCLSVPYHTCMWRRRGTGYRNLIIGAAVHWLPNSHQKQQYPQNKAIEIPHKMSFWNHSKTTNIHSAFCTKTRFEIYDLKNCIHSFHWMWNMDHTVSYIPQWALSSKWMI